MAVAESTSSAFPAYAIAIIAIVAIALISAAILAYVFSPKISKVAVVSITAMTNRSPSASSLETPGEPDPIPVVVDNPATANARAMRQTHAPLTATDA